MTTSTAGSTSASSSLLGGSRSASISTTSGSQLSNINTNAALFREIHKNTWLKRLSADGKKVTVGPKKSERSWVVFCVHDDSKALLEGYAEPRQAASHNPEWVVSMQETQHISHALIPNSHEFEFVVTLSHEVVRFHAMSWEVMQEWVETLRSKLREMKILSPRENLYTKLPEIRAPLLPTRDPTSPLPAPPPVPAALVPGVERVVPQSVMLSTVDITATTATITATTTVSEQCSNLGSSATVSNATLTTTSPSISANYFSNNQTIQSLSTTPPHSSHLSPNLISMSNTLSQNLLNMLSDPIIAYSEQLHCDNLPSDISSIADEQNATTFPSLNEDLTSLEQKSKHAPNKKQATSVESTESINDIITNENSVRLDVGTIECISIDQNKILENLTQSEKITIRPQTSRSHSLSTADGTRRQHLLANNAVDIKTQSKSSVSNNVITELQVSQDAETTQPTRATNPETNITIIQVTNAHEELLTEYASNKQLINLDKTIMAATAADVFTFPESPEMQKHEEYKSNVQIIPSNLNNSSTIQVIGQNVTTVANQYTTPVKKSLPQTTTTAVTTLDSATAKTNVFSGPGSHLENHKITTVHVGDAATTAVPSVYGTCYTSPVPALSITPVLSKKIILSANTSGITNITVNTTSSAITKNNAATAADNNARYNVGSVRYEKVFLSSSLPVAKPDIEDATTTVVSSATTRASSIAPLSPTMATHLSSHQRQPNSIPKIDRLNPTAASSSSLPSSPTPLLAFSALAIQTQKPSTYGQVLLPSTVSHSSVMRSNSKQLQGSLQPIPKTDVGSGGSPAMQRKVSSPNHHVVTAADSPPVPTRTRFLTRGLTEAVITGRPSRKDFCTSKAKAEGKVEQQSSSDNGSGSSNNSNAVTSNNNIEAISSQNNCEIGLSQTHSVVGRTRSESLEQRRRSSSTSEAQTQRTRHVTNNNEFIPNRSALGAAAAAMRMQQPPHSFRNLENGASSPSISVTASATKRMTLREQQVMQLRREIMHPGGVRLQLRRKDCVGSIAWVDAFGAIWVAGWKQKEHPVLYNALHIGDQLLSIAGISINTAAEANKIIRNTNTLFVEVLIRRIPFGRGYAIRRDREGQCLGLIRDGNTSTIVDVVPNSLAARHGLHPKAQSCDGSTLTFWMLTEINGRPLNLFCKENEIRDRLNSVGRDISILVQPSDLITKLKKQLKSLRSYKDYLVQ